MKDELWTCKDGRVIKVQDMTEQHAKNVLRMMIRYNREYQEDSWDENYLSEWDICNI